MLAPQREAVRGKTIASWGYVCAYIGCDTPIPIHTEVWLDSVGERRRGMPYHPECAHIFEWDLSHWNRNERATSARFHRLILSDLEAHVTEVTLTFNREGTPPVADDKHTPSIPGVPADFKVDLETYNKAYTKKWQDLTEFEKAYRHQNPEATDAVVFSAVNDHLHERMTMLESLIAVHKLEWVMSWRVFDERLKIASEAEKTRIRKKDAEHRSVVEGTEPKVARERKARTPTHVPANPEEKKEMTIRFLMERFKLTREEAMERLQVVAAVKKVNEG